MFFGYQCQLIVSLQFSQAISWSIIWVSCHAETIACLLGAFYVAVVAVVSRPPTCLTLLLHMVLNSFVICLLSSLRIIPSILVTLAKKKSNKFKSIQNLLSKIGLFRVSLYLYLFEFNSTIRFYQVLLISEFGKCHGAASSSYFG